MTLRWTMVPGFARRLFTTISAAADDWALPGTERWSISAGAFLPDFRTKLQANTSFISDVEDNPWRGYFDFRYWGPQSYFEARF